ncbi:hypothetical protein Tco_1348796, partial [Tanacetum coccineum]
NVEGMMNSDKRVMAGKGEDIQYLSVLNVAGERPFHLYGTLASEVLVWYKFQELAGKAPQLLCGLFKGNWAF